MTFDPNSMTFEEGVQRIKKAVEAAGVSSERILTSKDANIKVAVEHLITKNVPDGFSKWQLPVFQDGPTQFFMSFGSPNVEVPEHSHDEGDGMRLIMTGSIHYGSKELHAGDWMFIPKGQKYSFKVGSQGVGMFYCYQCCCAGRFER